MGAYALESSAPAFAGAREQFEGIVTWLDGSEAAELTHGDLEARLQAEGRELLRQLMQDHLDLRAEREVRLEDVVGADGVHRAHVESGHTRALRTVFGQVTVTRKAYRKPDHGNLHPLDAALNLPAEKYSHGLRQLAAIESARGSFEAAAEAIERITGHALGKKQLRLLVQRSVQDFEAFYEQRSRHLSLASDLLVLSCDGKGIVMRPEALREATRRAAREATNKLQTRLSKGEKRNRKRMAEVGAVYDCTPVVRSSADVLSRGEDNEERNVERPKARAKWLTASVVENTREVVAKVFDEAQRRDPERRRQWVVLVDGLNHQIDCIENEASKRELDLVDPRRLHPRARVPLEGRLVLLRGGRRRRREVGPRPRLHDPAGPQQRRRRSHPSQGHLSRPRRGQPEGRGQVCRLPHQQAALPRLRHGPRARMADRHWRDRGRLPPPHHGPDGPHRRPVGTARRRGDPQAPSPAQQRRLRRLLALPPATRARARSPSPLRDPALVLTLRSLQKTRTQI